MTKGAEHFLKKGVYMANFTLTEQMEDHLLHWNAFVCSWRGEKVDWYPELTTQLAQITNIGVGTAFPGKAAKFHVELASISSTSSQLTHGLIDLATFDGKATHTWKS